MDSNNIAEESFKPSSLLPYRIRLSMWVPFGMVIYTLDCTNGSSFFTLGWVMHESTFAIIQGEKSEAEILSYCPHESLTEKIYLTFVPIFVPVIKSQILVLSQRITDLWVQNLIVYKYKMRCYSEMQQEIFQLFYLKQYKWCSILTYTVWKMGAFKIKTMTCLQQQRRVEEGNQREEKQSLRRFGKTALSSTLVNYVMQEALQTECQVVQSCTDNSLHVLVTTSTSADRFPPELRLFKQAIQSTSSQIPSVSFRKDSSSLTTERSKKG